MFSYKVCLISPFLLYKPLGLTFCCFDNDIHTSDVSKVSLYFLEPLSTQNQPGKPFKSLSKVFSVLAFAGV